MLRPNESQKEPPRLGSPICYGQTWARKSHRDSAVRFVTAKRGPERATKTRQHDLLRPRVGQKKPPRLGSTICYGQELARKSHQDSAVRLVTAKRGPERAIKTRQYDLLRPRVGQKKPPRLGSTICYGQTWARKSHQDSAVRFVTAKSWPERATKTRQYDLLRPNVGQKKPPRLGSAICYGHEIGQKEPPRFGSTFCYGQTCARKSHQDSAVRFVTANRKSHRDSAVRCVTAKCGPERATKTRQSDLLRPNVPPRLGSTICHGQELARKSHRDSAVRFVTAKSWPERATKTRQYDLLRPNVGQKEPPRLGSTICYGQELARKSHRDSAVRFVAAKRGPERATKTRICYGQVLARKSHRDSAVLFVTATRLARKSHQDSAVRFVTAKRVPERATKTRQYDLLRPRVGQKEPPRLGSTICYGQELARKSHQASAVRFVTAKSWPERATETRQYDLIRPTERATETRQYDLLRPNVGQKEPPRLGSPICYGQELARISHQDSAVRFVTAKRGPEKATKTRQYDLLRPRVGQKESRRLGSTICYGQELARKSHRDSAVRFDTPERATKTRQYDLLRPRVGQKEPPRLGSKICYGQDLARKSHQDSAVRFVTAKRGPERDMKTRQYDLFRPNVGQKEPPRLGSMICCGQELARKSHGDSAVRFVTAKSWPERATKTRQYDLLRPNVGQKEPPRLGSTICYGQELARKSHQRLGSTICYGQTWARKSHQDSAVRFVTAKSWPERATETRQHDLLRPTERAERATKTRQYDLLRPNVCQKKPPRLGSTICYGEELARKSHQDSAVRVVAAKSWPKRATKTRQYDLLRPNVGQKEPPRLGSTICYGQEVARQSHQDSAVRFVTAKSWPERATKTRQYDLLRPRVVCYGQTWARKSHQDSAVRFVTAKSCPERATKTRQYDLLRPRVGQKEP